MARVLLSASTAQAAGLPAAQTKVGAMIILPSCQDLSSNAPCIRNDCMTTLPHTSQTQTQDIGSVCTFFHPPCQRLFLASLSGSAAISICISLIFQCRTHTTPSQNVREQRDRGAVHDAKLDLEVELCPGFLGRILCWAPKHPHGARALQTTESSWRQCHSLNRMANTKQNDKMP